MRVLVADDHPLVTDAVAQYCRQIDPDAQVVGAASLGEAEARLAEMDGVDLILLDSALPGMNGIQGLVAVREKFPGVPVVLMADGAGNRELREALYGGAAGILPKEMPGAAIVKALELVLAGVTFVPSRLLSAPGLEEAPAAYDALARAPRGPLGELTGRQREVLSLLMQGLFNRQIAQRLDVVCATVNFHLKHIYRKLGVSNRTQAVFTASKLGWKFRNEA